MGDILFLAHRVPFPPDRGDKMRSYHLLRHLAGLARVHLATFADDAADLAHADALRPLLAGLHVEIRTRSRSSAGFAALAGGRAVSVALFDSSTMRAAVDATLSAQDIDTIFAFSGQMAQYVPSSGAPRFVMDFVDMDSAKFAAYAADGAGPMRWVNRREGRRLFDFERKVAARADVSLFVSEAEAALFRARSGLGVDRVQVLENGIDLDVYDPAADFAPLGAARPGQGPLIVFTGQMDYRPNAEAVTQFATRSLPAIRAAVPTAHFAIVGRNPDAQIRGLADLPGVTVTGAVPDVRSWLVAADVVVAPLRLARGVQNKVLEAMAMARPLVVSPAAHEGIDATPGVHLVVADAADEADAVVGLLADPVRARTIAAAGRARIEARYGWPARLAGLAALVGCAAAPGLGAAA